MAKKTPDLALFVGMLVPIDSVDDAQTFDVNAPPHDASIIAAEILDRADLTSDAEWEHVGYNIMLSFASRVRKAGWPSTGQEIELADDVEIEQEAKPFVEPEIEDPHANVGQPGDPGRCWNCSAHLIVNARGSFCPAGCDDSPDANAGFDEDLVVASPEAEPLDNASRISALETKIDTLTALLTDGLPPPSLEAEDDNITDSINNYGITEVTKTGAKINKIETVDKPVKKGGKTRGKKRGRNVGKKPRKLENESLAQIDNSVSTGSGTVLDPYKSTPESPKPSSFPQNPPIPTTD